jgi:uncharacterized protein
MLGKTRIRRLPELGSEDPDLMRAILDDGMVCHVGYLVEDRPVVIPTLYARDGDRILLHGSTASGIVMAARRGSPLSIAITHLDALVVARSGFESSMNYRSVVIHGIGTILGGDAHAKALDLLVGTLIPGRLADIRPPTDSELRKTAVIAMPLEEWSMKISTGPPQDEPFDLDTGVWAGLVPIVTRFGTPEPSPDLEPGVDVPDYLIDFRQS